MAVGLFSLAAEANPTEVNVGDPITLNVMITGAEHMDNVVLAPLSKEPEISNNFKVPDEMAPGEIDGRMKVFTQTIRAKHSSVKEIPSISLNYFNPVTGKYELASTKPIPLQVNTTKIVTAKDVEGGTPGISKSELASLNKGIAHNYVGDDILENQEFEIASWFSSPIGLVLILFPPGTYLLVLIPAYFRRKRLQNVETRKAQKALPEFSKEITRLQKEINRNELQQTISGLVEAIRIYLSKRLLMPPGALVYTEVADRLQKHGMEEALLAELKSILDWCESHHYGAIDSLGSSRENLQEKLVDAQGLFNKIDQSFKKQAGVSS